MNDCPEQGLLCWLRNPSIVKVFAAVLTMASLSLGDLTPAMCVRPQPFQGAEAAHFPLGPKLPRRHVASEISD